MKHSPPPSYKESLNYNIDTQKNLKSFDQKVLKELKGKTLKVNTNNTNSTARIYYEKQGKTTVVDGIADGQRVKVLGHKSINGEMYLQVGYNMKKDGSYVGEGFMKPQILHKPEPTLIPLPYRPNIPKKPKTKEKPQENFKILTQENFKRFSKNIGQPYQKEMGSIFYDFHTLSQQGLKILEKKKPEKVPEAIHIIEAFKNHDNSLHPGEKNIQAIIQSFEAFLALIENCGEKGECKKILDAIIVYLKKKLPKLKDLDKQMKPFYEGVSAYQEKNNIHSREEAKIKYELEIGSSLNFGPVEKKQNKVTAESPIIELYGKEYKNKSYSYYEVESFSKSYIGDISNQGTVIHQDLILINKEAINQKDLLKKSTIENELSHLILLQIFPNAQTTLNIFKNFKSSNTPDWKITNNISANEFLSDVVSINRDPKGEIDRIISNGFSEDPVNAFYDDTHSFMKLQIKQMFKNDPEIKDFLETGKLPPKKETTKIFPKTNGFNVQKFLMTKNIVNKIISDPTKITLLQESYMNTGKEVLSYITKHEASNN